MLGTLQADVVRCTGSALSPVFAQYLTHVRQLEREFSRYMHRAFVAYVLPGDELQSAIVNSPAWVMEELSDTNSAYVTAILTRLQKLKQVFASTATRGEGPGGNVPPFPGLLVCAQTVFFDHLCEVVAEQLVEAYALLAKISLEGLSLMALDLNHLAKGMLLMNGLFV